MKRRILSILTALALCLSLCPSWAFAEEALPEETQEENQEETREEAPDEFPQETWNDTAVTAVTGPHGIEKAFEGQGLNGVTFTVPAAQVTITIGAGDPVYYERFQDAWAAAVAGGAATVTLLRDVDLGDQYVEMPISSDSSVTLTGPGFTLTGSGEQTILVRGGTLTVKDVTGENTRVDVYSGDGITATNGNELTPYIGNVIIEAGAKVTAQRIGIGLLGKDTTLTVAGTVEPAMGDAISAGSSSSATVKEGAVISAPESYGVYQGSSSAALRIEGGRISGYYGAAIYGNGGLLGGTFIGTGGNAIFAREGGKIQNGLASGRTVYRGEDPLQITAALTAEELEKDGTGSGTFTINPAKPTISWPANAEENLDYTGRAAALTTTPAVMLLGAEQNSGTISYSYSTEESGVYVDGLPTDAGLDLRRQGAPRL